MTGSEDHTIKLDEASAWTQNYRDTINSGDTIAHAFGKDAIQAILDQNNCVGIRIYYALDEDGHKQLIIVGVNSQDNDLYEGLLAERSYRCPSTCSSNNPLNSSL